MVLRPVFVWIILHDSFVKKVDIVEDQLKEKGKLYANATDIFYS